VIFEEALAALAPQDLAGEKILVTAGPTREEIDPIRFISNYSSGKMGYAIARAARRRGAEVNLVSGPTSLDGPYGVTVAPVVSAREMRDVVLAKAPGSTIIIKAAAVADFRPILRAEEKIKKTEAPRTLDLARNPDILEELGMAGGKWLLVGFAAETGDLLQNAEKKLIGKNLDMVVANDISQAGAGFNTDTNIVKLLFRGGRVESLPIMSKEDLADVILDRLVDMRIKRG
jgi:phosphopantothenoylcysteine decarboxylase/phosphopantothenate--cysteine ligase